jgi:hypothetical protein
MADHAIGRVEFLALRDGIGIATVFVDADGLEILDRQRFDFSRRKRKRHRRIVQRAFEIG